jgi:hypothetical protein
MPKKKPKPDNIIGVLMTVVSIGLLALFLFGLLTPGYRQLTLSISVGIIGSGLLICSAVLGWRMTQRQY